MSAAKLILWVDVRGGTLARRGESAGGGGWERAQIGDDGLGVGVIQMVDVHGRLDGAAVGGLAHFEDALHLLVAVAGQAGERRRELRPILDVARRLNPDGRALKPLGTFELHIGVARRVALRAFGDLFDEIAAVRELSIGRSRIDGAAWRGLRSAQNARRFRAENQQEAGRRQ